MSPASRPNLAAMAATLRALHVPGRPLVLPNAWDAASARLIEAAGFAAIATTSEGVASSLGYSDGEAAPPDEMFAAIARIARLANVPVTADIEAGYGLEPAELVDRLLDAGAAGFNIEDSDHRSGGLVDAGRQADRIAGLRAAIDRSGVPLVINARVDVYLHDNSDTDEKAAEAFERCGCYLAAGADCAFPVLLASEQRITWLADQLNGRINVFAGPTSPPLPRLAALGVARISLGPWVRRLAMREAEAVLADVRAGRDPYPGRYGRT